MFLRCLAFVLNTGDKKCEERVQRDERDYIEMTLTFFRGNKEKIFSVKKEKLDKTERCRLTMKPSLSSPFFFLFQRVLTFLSLPLK